MQAGQEMSTCEWGRKGQAHARPVTPAGASRVRLTAERAGKQRCGDVNTVAPPIMVHAEFAQGELFEILEDDQSLPEEIVQVS